MQFRISGIPQNIYDYTKFPTVYTEDKIPYNFRRSLDVGSLEEDKLVGGTVAFNQLVEHGDFDATTGWNAVRGSLSVSGNVGTLSVSEVAISTVCNRIRRTISFINTHKYFVSYDVKVSKAVTISSEATSNSGNAWEGILSEVSVSANTWTRYEKIKLSSTTASCYFGIGANNTSGAGLTTSDTLQFRNVNLIDLTQMFGSTIADYIYSLEQATKGAGVAYFRNLFPNSYYAYNAGQLMSVKTSKHITVGFNQWDEEWESGAYNTYGASGTGAKINASGYTRTKNFIPAFPNTTYHMHRPHSGNQLYIGFYDVDKNWLGYSSEGVVWNLIEQEINFTTSANTHYMVFYDLGDIAGTCLNLSDTSLNGTYKPYQANSYQLASNLELRGLFKLDANNSLYCDGDIYESSGKVTRKYGIVDLGSLSWTYDSNDNYFYSSQPTNILRGGTNNICSQYIFNGNPVSSMPDYSYKINASGYVIVVDSRYTDAPTFKTAMSGVYLIYELATPTTETSDPYINPQSVDSYGTEEYVDNREVAIPVGHETKYQKSLGVYRNM